MAAAFAVPHAISTCDSMASFAEELPSTNYHLQVQYWHTEIATVCSSLLPSIMALQLQTICQRQLTSGCVPDQRICTATPHLSRRFCAAEGDLRLSGGGTSESGAQFGRLEVFSTGGWGTVCGGLQRASGRFGIGTAQPVVFSEASADVACQQLGFQEGVLTATPVRMLSMHVMDMPGQRLCDSL